jgi:hypothetical protein
MLEERHTDLLHLMSEVSCDKTEKRIESNIKTVCCTTVPSTDLSTCTDMTCRKLNRVTENTTMGESNGTTLKPLPPIFLLNKLMQFGKYKYCGRTAGVRGRRVLGRLAEGKC